MFTSFVGKTRGRQGIVVVVVVVVVVVIFQHFSDTLIFWNIIKFNTV